MGLEMSRLFTSKFCCLMTLWAIRFGVDVEIRFWKIDGCDQTQSLTRNFWCTYVGEDLFFEYTHAYFQCWCLCLNDVFNLESENSHTDSGKSIRMVEKNIKHTQTTSKWKYLHCCGTFRMVSLSSSSSKPHYWICYRCFRGVNAVEPIKTDNIIQRTLCKHLGLSLYDQNALMNWMFGWSCARTLNIHITHTYTHGNHVICVGYELCMYNWEMLIIIVLTQFEWDT